MNAFGQLHRCIRCQNVQNDLKICVPGKEPIRVAFPNDTEISRRTLSKQRLKIAKEWRDAYDKHASDWEAAARTLTIDEDVSASSSHAAETPTTGVPEAGMPEAGSPPDAEETPTPGVPLAASLPNASPTEEASPREQVGATEQEAVVATPIKGTDPMPAHLQHCSEDLLARDPILHQFLDIYSTLYGRKGLDCALKGCFRSDPSYVWINHHNNGHDVIDMIPPVLARANNRSFFTPPGNGFVCMASDCMQVLEIFLHSCSYRNVAPDRWNWEYILVKLMEELNDVDENTARFAKLVCLVLSGKTRDFGCIKYTVRLHHHGYLDIGRMANANPTTIKNIIWKTGYQRKRSEYLVRMAIQIRDEHDGIVPGNISELIKMDGVGRKTAVITLNEAFGQFEGIGCDVHVSQCCEAFEFAQCNGKRLSPAHAEMALREWIPERNFRQVNRIFGSFAQLFTQDLPLRGQSINDDERSLAIAVCKAAGDFIHRTYHVQLLFCMICAMRKHYRWISQVREMERASRPPRKKHRGQPKGDSDPELSESDSPPW